MALDPSIILRAGDFAKIDPGQLLEARSQLRLRNAAIAKAQREESEAARMVSLRSLAGQQFSKGDAPGAVATVAGGGDLASIKTFQDLDDAQRKRTYEIAQRTAPMLTALGELPPADRPAALQRIAPALVEAGFKPDHIGQIDLSDAGLQAIGQSALTVAQQYERQDKAADRTLRHEEATATRDFQRGNAYISAGLIPPGTGGAGGGAAIQPGGRTQFGWTPRARNGGDNTDEAVDNKIGGMAKALGVDPDAPLTNLTPIQIAGALALSEGGPGSIADKNNNPGNLRDPKTGAYRKFPTKAAGMAAAAAQVQRNLSRGQNTIRTMVEGLPVGGGSAAPAGPGGLAVIPGGKLDKPKATRMTAAEIAAEGLDPNMAYYRDTNGVPQAVSGQSKTTSLKTAPAGALTSYQENTASVRQVQQALQLLDPKNNSPAAKAARAAIGPGTGALGDTFTQYNDPKGTDFRAMIGRIGGIIIKDTSGAAVSASEDSRLAKWVPLPTDTPDAARAKLRNLANAITNTQQAFDDIYNEENGYRPLRVRGTLSAPPGTRRPPAASAGPKPGTVENGYRFKGGNPASPSSWEKVK